MPHHTITVCVLRAKFMWYKLESLVIFCQEVCFNISDSKYVRIDIVEHRSNSFALDRYLIEFDSRVIVIWDEDNSYYYRKSHYAISDSKYLRIDIVKHRSNTFALHQYLIDVDTRVFVIWDEDISYYYRKSHCGENVVAETANSPLWLEAKCQTLCTKTHVQFVAVSLWTNFRVFHGYRNHKR